MDLGDIEGEARLLLRLHGQDDSERPRVIELAKRVLGVGVQVVHSRALPGDGALATVLGERRIYVRRGLTPERLVWVVAHELGHLALGLDSSSGENEDACNAFAAAVLAPSRAFRMALAEAGPSYSKLARWFLTSESCAALRLGEVTGCPLALLAPARVRVRGDDFAWPDDIRNSRIKKAQMAILRDDRRRVVLRIA